MDAQAVGQRIKAAREAKGLTQEGLAALVDLSPTHVSVIERGLKIPNLDSFVAIANALGVSADSLLIDVVDHATESAACELSNRISHLPHRERMKILNAFRILTEELETSGGSRKGSLSFYRIFIISTKDAIHRQSFYVKVVLKNKYKL